MKHAFPSSLSPHPLVSGALPGGWCSLLMWHPCTPRSSVIHACSWHVEERAGPGEGKLQLCSSLPVSGWQGFFFTPPHSPNEVIKRKNGAWKQTCSWGQRASRDDTPQPITFCLAVFWKQEGRMRQFLQRICNIFIWPGWRRRQAATSTLYLWRNWEIFTSISSRKHLEWNMTSVGRARFCTFATWLQEAKEELWLWGPCNCRSSESLSPEVLFQRSPWIGRRGASRVDLSGGIQFWQVIWGGTLQPKWLFFSGSSEHFQSWGNFLVFPTEGLRLSSMRRLRRFQSEHICNILLWATHLIRVRLCSSGLCCNVMIRYQNIKKKESIVQQKWVTKLA